MKPMVTPSSPQEEFPYGYRYVQRGDTFDQVPLTLEDVLHPQENDVIPGNIPHDQVCRYLAGEFESRPLAPPLGLVTHDLLINWGVPGIGNHSPDVAVFVGLSRHPGWAGTLQLASLGGRCELVVEVVSPSTRNNDVVKKYDHYYRIGIPLYVLIDQEDEAGPRSLHAYRHTPAGYVEVSPDAQGRITLPPLGLLLGLRDDRAVCFDAVTGEEMRDHTGLKQETQRQREEALQQKEEADRAMTEQVDAFWAVQRREAEALLEAERQRLARVAADEEAERQRLAREAADQEAKRASQEAERQRLAREAADQEAERQRLARVAADQEAERQRLARVASDLRIHELEEALRRSQAGGSGNTTNPAP